VASGVHLLPGVSACAHLLQQSELAAFVGEVGRIETDPGDPVGHPARGRHPGLQLPPDPLGQGMVGERVQGPPHPLANGAVAGLDLDQHPERGDPLQSVHHAHGQGPAYECHLVGGGEGVVVVERFDLVPGGDGTGMEQTVLPRRQAMGAQAERAEAGGDGLPRQADQIPQGGNPQPAEGLAQLGRPQGVDVETGQKMGGVLDDETFRLPRLLGGAASGEGPIGQPHPGPGRDSRQHRLRERALSSVVANRSLHPDVGQPRLAHFDPGNHLLDRRHHRFEGPGLGAAISRRRVGSFWLRGPSRIPHA
jgi:hypothetical protein